MAITYELEYWQTSDPDGTRQRVNGITGASHTITGLDQLTEYAWRNRKVDTVSGIRYWTKWVNGAAFTTLSAPVEVNLGSAGETDEAHSVFAANDDIAPTITLQGGSKVVVELGTVWSDPGYTANDNIDGDISGSVAVGGDVVNMSEKGIYFVTYNVQDSSLNDAVEVVREVHVNTAQPATSWNLRYQQANNPGSMVQVNDLTTPSYTIAGLLASTDYEFQVQGAIGSTVSDWSAFSQFTTDVDAGVVVNPGVAVESDSAQSAAPSIDPDNELNAGTATEADTANTINVDAGGALEVNTGAASESDTAPSITPDVVVPVDVNIGSASESDTANAVTPSQQIAIQPHKYDLELVDVLTGAVTLIQNVRSPYTLTGLDPHTLYKYRAKGFWNFRQYESVWSDYSAEFITNGTPFYLTGSGQTLGDLDVFQIVIDDTYTGDDTGEIRGSTSHYASSVVVDFGGHQLAATVIDNDFIAHLTGARRLGLDSNDELAWPGALLLEGTLQATGNDAWILE